jgi:hypothetical protein
MSFPSKETTQALKEFGCLIPNCRQTYWEVTSEKNMGIFAINATMRIDYIIFAGVQVLHKNQSI